MKDNSGSLQILSSLQFLLIEIMNGVCWIIFSAIMNLKDRRRRPPDIHRVECWDTFLRILVSETEYKDKDKGSGVMIF